MLSENRIRTFIKESNAIEDVHDEDAIGTSLATYEILTQYDELTADAIKEAHQKLLSDRQPQIAGEYRTQYVQINGEIPPEPEEVPELMDNLLSTVPTTQFEAIDWHIRFEKIHPFIDGNGRIGRLIYLYHCTQCADAKPIIWRENNRFAYYGLFAEDGFSPVVINSESNESDENTHKIINATNNRYHLECLNDNSVFKDINKENVDHCPSCGVEISHITES